MTPPYPTKIPTPCTCMRTPLYTQIMHAYIDSEQFGGLTLDEALRKLLRGFRCAPVHCGGVCGCVGGCGCVCGWCVCGVRTAAQVWVDGLSRPNPITQLPLMCTEPILLCCCKLPGEGPKMDHTMEKFAERYCLPTPP